MALRKVAWDILIENAIACIPYTIITGISSELQCAFI